MMINIIAYKYSNNGPREHARKVDGLAQRMPLSRCCMLHAACHATAGDWGAAELHAPSPHTQQ
eukprot:355715-Chlamydomonas_euryale.AAC.8